MTAKELPVTVRAAGAVLWRQAGTGAVEIAVVHRPRYDDWTLPKGKLEPGETVAAAAVREIAEETGFAVRLGRFLGQVSYSVPGRDGEPTGKLVDFFSGQATGGAFAPNEEVNELRWLDAAAAEALLSRHTDVEILREFCALPVELTTVLLVRHGKAGKRDDWSGDDDLRPLSNAGTRQAEAIRALAALFEPELVYSAPRLRCVRTVSGVAEDRGTEVSHEPLLSEEGYWKDPVRARARFREIAAAGSAVVCSQGGVIPTLVTELAELDGVPVRLRGRTADTADPVRPVPAKKGSVWLLAFQPSGVDGPKLVSAAYFGSPLPTPQSAPAPARQPE